MKALFFEIIISPVFFTALLVMLTGFYVMHKGDWTKMKLKYIAVSLSTTASIFLFFNAFLQNSYNCPLDDMQCFVFETYSIVRNIAFICFNVAFGRDAMAFKKRDRRSKNAGFI